MKDILTWYEMSFANDKDLGVHNLPGGNCFLAAASLDTNLKELQKNAKPDFRKTLNWKKKILFDLGIHGDEFFDYLVWLEDARTDLYIHVAKYVYSRGSENPMHWTELANRLQDEAKRVWDKTGLFERDICMSIRRFFSRYCADVKRNINHGPGIYFPETLISKSKEILGVRI